MVKIIDAYAVNLDYSYRGVFFDGGTSDAKKIIEVLDFIFLATGFSGKRTDLVYGTVHVLKHKFFFFIEST